MHVLMIGLIDIGNAKIAGLTDDLDIPSWKYEWLLTVFYITYVLFEWMTLMYRLVPPHIYVSLCVCGWGLVASFQSLATSFGAMLVLRMFLGVTEAAFGPGVPFYLSLFYKREELAFRIALFISAAPLATSFASTLAWVIVKFSHDGPIAPWRTLFLVEGFPSVVVAVFAWALIPDSPEKAHFLAPRERMVAELRLERNRKAGAYRDLQKGKFNWQEVWKTLADPKAYITAVSAHVFSRINSVAEVPIHLFSSCSSAAISHLVPCQFSCLLLSRSTSSNHWLRPKLTLLQHGILLSYLPGTLRTPLPRRIRRGASHHVLLRPQSHPQSIPNHARPPLLHILPSNRSNWPLLHPPLNQNTRRHPLSLRLSSHIRLLLRHLFNPRVDDG